MSSRLPSASPGGSGCAGPGAFSLSLIHILLEYACFVSFFPCVTSGPIAFHDEVIPQMRAVQGKGPSAQGIAEGLWLFSLGIWKKVIVAEAFGGGADWGWANLPALNLSLIHIYKFCRGPGRPGGGREFRGGGQAGQSSRLILFTFFEKGA